MEIKTQTLINASKEKVWQVISNIENAKDNISAIQNIEVLEKPENGLIGLKWVETRIMFGKSATETMWITHAEENQYYQTRAESHGAIYISKLSLEEKENQTELTMSFKGEAQTTGAKIMSAVMGWMVKGSMVKAVKKDLEDIKSIAENN